MAVTDDVLTEVRRALESRADDAADRALEKIILATLPDSLEARAIRLSKAIEELKYFSTTAISKSHSKGSEWLDEASREAFALRIGLLENRKRK